MFIVSLTYKKPLEAVDKHLAAHRDFLKTQYDAGVFIVSGGKIPRTGGIIIASVASKDLLETILQQDPFHLHGISDYDIINFSPAMCNDAFRKIKQHDDDLNR